jgi:hypothetical protein
MEEFSTFGLDKLAFQVKANKKANNSSKRAKADGSAVEAKGMKAKRLSSEENPSKNLNVEKPPDVSNSVLEPTVEYNTQATVILEDNSNEDRMNTAVQKPKIEGISVFEEL